MRKDCYRLIKTVNSLEYPNDTAFQNSVKHKIDK